MSDELSIGENVVIRQNVTIGQKDRDGGRPILEDNVIVNAGAVVIGPIRIGEGATIGANSVVTHDVPRGAVVAGAPARVISMCPVQHTKFRT